MAKRKRTAQGEPAVVTAAAPHKKLKPTTQQTHTTIQIIAGSYDKVLHGVTARISPDGDVDFADTFLVDAHKSAIRCLAVSQPSGPKPKQTQKVILASAGNDDSINLYHLSAHAPTRIKIHAFESLNSKAVIENPQNRELGSLVHHSGSVTALHFPTRGKLLSSAEDSTIAVTRTRDWSLLSTIKAPIPKPVGRPSGDTAPMGGAPSGVNDFAVHPSLKLMISVGKGEKCMRLWNLVTGKKAGVLNFDRSMLLEVGEGRFSSGEGRKVAWGSTEVGDEFCVGFDKGALVFGMDCKPKCKVAPISWSEAETRSKTEPRLKIHQLSYFKLDEETDTQVLVMSAEDGRILFYSTADSDLTVASLADGKEPLLPSAKLIAQLGGKNARKESWEKLGKQIWREKSGQQKLEQQAEEKWTAKLATRVKDFAVLRSPGDNDFVISAASSDGTLRIWKVAAEEITPQTAKVKQVGTLIGTYETPNRITCMRAFVMLPAVEDAEEEEDFSREFMTEDDLEADGSSSDSE